MSQPPQFGRVSRPDEAMLARAVPEDVLEPDLALVDTHHHLFLMDDNPYPLDAYLNDAATGHHLLASVYVQGGHTWLAGGAGTETYRPDGPEELRSVGETEYVNELGERCAQNASDPLACAGIVGYVDLTLGDNAAAILEEHIRAGGGCFKGIRQSSAWDPDPRIGSVAQAPGTYARADFRTGLSRLTALGLSLDAWVFYHQLDELVDLARACPDANIIMGHCGGPLGYGPYTGRRDEVFAAWKHGMVKLAACQNVSIKLGGLTMRLASYDYTGTDRPPTSAELAGLWGPYVETCIELFGPGRAMFESNFPVDKMGIGWIALWNAYKRICAGMSLQEKTQLFSGTATRAYRLQVSDRRVSA